MQINLNPTSERGASRDAVNRPRETLGDSHLISSDPRSRFGLVCDLLCCRGNIMHTDAALFLWKPKWPWLKSKGIVPNSDDGYLALGRASRVRVSCL